VMLIDEVHTPDSSRYWKANTYKERFNAGNEPENFDKEFVRIAYAEKGYRGDGEIPSMPDELWVAASERYITIYEMLTGKTFEGGEYPVEPRLVESLRGLNIVSLRTSNVSMMEFNTTAEISRKAHELWNLDETWSLGRLLDTHIPTEKRGEWMSGILDVITPLIEKDESIDELLDFARNPNKFGKGLSGNGKAAHKVVDKVNRFPYTPEEFPITVFLLATHAGKVIYNTQDFGAPFDYDASSTAFEMAKILTRKFQDEQFEKKLWAALCPINLLVVEKQSIFPVGWV